MLLFTVNYVLILVILYCKCNNNRFPGTISRDDYNCIRLGKKLENKVVMELWWNAAKCVLLSINWYSIFCSREKVSSARWLLLRSKNGGLESHN